MELVQKLISGTIVAGGVGTTAYYSVGKSDGISIETYVTSRKRKLISEEAVWKQKEDKYKRLEDKSEDLIGEVENKDSKKTPVWRKLEKWCIKTKKKMFTDPSDGTYQHFIWWCLEEIDIKNQLELEGIKEVTNFEAKATQFNDPSNLDSSFITGTGQPAEGKGKKPVTKDDVSGWCNPKKSTPFKHELEQTYLRVKKWCFEEPEKPKESTTKKPK
ncbi:hypothetical protein HF1_13860 [Mycoplasma haemofelis str. Langford 1]|uniref:Uncharacterized protein n=1 Tax=Mycoplasma haemofelis (strain Langford 1) TaxID=941640 RepID=E8ZJS3_MYCHL|nr:hypothetical protein [Mycoplasma haemofelis]CBY93394.1 hypothetical protein HF1_13860 [Mycoplasma haemofelis str. Langford 1]